MERSGLLQKAELESMSKAKTDFEPEMEARLLNTMKTSPKERE